MRHTFETLGASLRPMRMPSQSSPAPQAQVVSRAWDFLSPAA
jgi:hypothetical protein